MSLAGGCGSGHCTPPAPPPPPPFCSPGLRLSLGGHSFIMHDQENKFPSSLMFRSRGGHGLQTIRAASVCYHVPCGQLEATMEFQKRALLPPCLALHYDPLESVANSNTFINKVSHPGKISVLVYFCLPNTCRKY